MLWRSQRQTHGHRVHGQHGEDLVKESNESSVCRTGGSERELISKVETYRGLLECRVDACFNNVSFQQP